MHRSREGGREAGARFPNRGAQLAFLIIVVGLKSNVNANSAMEPS
jgi:hypothetical protein